MATAGHATQPPLKLPPQPLAFEPNQGQANDQVSYLARGKGYELFLAPTEAVLSLKSASAAPKILRMRLVGAAAQARMRGQTVLQGRHHYYIGNDPKRWHTGIPTYGKVISAGVYPGIDMVYRGMEGQLEYDFMVAPRADPSAIRLAFAGNDAMTVNAQGDLILKIGGERVVHRAPYAYQTLNGREVPVAARYAIAAKTVTFTLGRYDTTKPLIIDPALIYASYLGGTGNDEARAVAVDSAGNIYLTGMTASNDFPGVGTAPNGGSSDAFVTMLNSSGTVVFSTYLGSSGDLEVNPERGNGLAISNGRIYVTGGTASHVTDGKTFPVIAPYQSCGINTGYVFVSILNNDGTLSYSTCVGVGLYQEGTGIAVDAVGNAYVVGWTNAGNFPVTSGALQTTKNTDANIRNSFFFKLDPGAGAIGSGLIYSTYLGCNLGAVICGSTYAAAVAVDGSGLAYVAGWTDVKDTEFPIGFPSTTAFQSILKGTQDAFFYKIDPAGTGASSLLYGSYFGGTDAGSGKIIDRATGVAVDSAGNIYISGHTTSASGFPITSPYQNAFGGGTALGDAFVAKFNSAGGDNYTLGYATYLGGSGEDAANAIAVDSTTGRAYVTGVTSSANFPVAAVGGLQNTFRGGTDAFVTSLDASGTSLHYSTYLGGIGGEQGLGIAVQAGEDKAYVAGGASSTDLPVTADAKQAGLKGGVDAFVAVIAKAADMAVTLNATTPAPPLLGALTYTASVSNKGPDLATGVTLTLTLSAFGTSVPLATDGTLAYDTRCTIDAQETLTCSLGTMASGDQTTVTLTGTLTTAQKLTAAATVSAIETDTQAANNSYGWELIAGSSSVAVPPITVQNPGSGSSGGGGTDPFTLLTILGLMLASATRRGPSGFNHAAK